MVPDAVAKSMDRCLILTAHYAAGALELPESFLRSLRKTGSSAEVVLIANHGGEDHEKDLAEMMPGARLWVPIPKQRYRVLRRAAIVLPAFAKAVALALRSSWQRHPKSRPHIELWAAHLLNITCSRYLLARRFLAECTERYDRVLLADSRDVIFQRDPFANIGPGLTTGVESVLVRDQPANRQWVEHLYGDDPSFPMDDVLAQNVICSGVTLGDTISIVAYLERMCSEFIDKLPRIVHQPYYDQGVHIKLLRSGDVAGVGLLPNGNGLIATIGTSDLSEFKRSSSGLQTLGGDLVSIVHQYDRHHLLAGELKAALAKR